MELLILQGLQQDIKIFLLSPILCAIFRFLFIYFFAPNKTYKGQEKNGVPALTMDFGGVWTLMPMCYYFYFC